MGAVSFKQLPLIVKTAVGVTFFDAWISLEEFVINRTGVWRYMPYYRTDDACVWDLGVGIVVVGGLWWLSSRSADPRR